MALPPSTVALQRFPFLLGSTPKLESPIKCVGRCEEEGLGRGRAKRAVGISLHTMVASVCVSSSPSLLPVMGVSTASI